MAISIVDQGGGTYWKLGTATTSTSVTCTYGTALTPGSLLVCVVATPGDPVAASGFSVSDGTQTWSGIAAASIPEASVLGRGLGIAYFPNNALSSTPTVTVSVASATNFALWIAEVLGCATTTPHEGSAENTAAGAGTVVMTGQSIAVASTAFMVSAAVYYPDNSSNMVAGTGYTKRYDAAPSAALSTYPYCIQDNVSGTGTQSVAWAAAAENKTYWAGVAAAFKAAASSSVVPGIWLSRQSKFGSARQRYT
jgi:hypothetical protein